MSRPRRPRSGSPVRRHLLTVVLAVSLVIGTTSAWLALGTSILVAIATMSAVALVLVHLLHRAGETGIGYGAAVLSGVLVVAAIGLLIAFGLLGVLWVCTLVVLATPVRTWWGQFWNETVTSDRDHEVTWARSRPSSTAPSAYDVTAGAERLRQAETELPGLELGALCQVWRSSYFEILDAVPPSGTVTVAHYRQRILDEIDRRDPEGLRRWLATEPRPSGNPLPYLQSGRTAPDDPGAQGTA